MRTQGKHQRRAGPRPLPFRRNTEAGLEGSHSTVLACLSENPHLLGCRGPEAVSEFGGSTSKPAWNPSGLGSGGFRDGEQGLSNTKVCGHQSCAPGCGSTNALDRS